MTKNIKVKILCFAITAALLFSFTACRQGNTGTSDISSSANIPSENYVEKLKSEGVDPNKIQSAELFVKRITLQLGEIQTFSSSFNPSSPNIDPYGENSSDTIKYSELSSKISEDKAVYYLVKLEKNFGSMEEIFDEYLLSLQLDIDFDKYLTDKDSYYKLREEKLSKIAESSLITVEDIERKALESLQKFNNSNNNSNFQGPATGNDIYNPSVNTIPNVVNPQPELPKVDIPRPIDPTEQFNR
ncbi:hypothetical protein [Acetivibrio straminisolvens]|uniref:Lipoprotein n=1 Tax=Acetivibrio straminisolvens JCM 21531 TaxID=1294263 RepID=W4VBJ6_9FIRM|nr:hypothetical protein [Acetivibrio straminisolvens]GAE90551.1 hypothetical protein JCM21531_4174 [Acetivibrio straminisolvens JCM 21531]